MKTERETESNVMYYHVRLAPAQNLAAYLITACIYAGDCNKVTGRKAQYVYKTTGSLCTYIGHVEATKYLSDGE